MVQGDVGSFCTHTAEVWAFFGRIIWVFKIIIPIILIALGVIGLGKAVIADDEKEIKTQTNKLIKKIIIGVIIFFIPTLVTALLTLVGNLDEGDYKVCVECINSPSSSACQNSEVTNN